jgi:mannose-6-phosphate isomerase-like protein (cupin superfamily)
MSMRSIALLSCLGLLSLTTGAAGQTSTAVPNWKGPGGPIDLRLQDPALLGAIDLHAHLDPDISGGGQAPRAMDAVDMAEMAKARGMRGFVHKTHMDISSAAAAYYARKAVPGIEVFGRFVLNLTSGGLNPAAVMQFTSMKGGWGRIVEMPTRDVRAPANDNRPWVTAWVPLFPNMPREVRTVRNGELVPEAKAIIALIARIKTTGSNGTVVLATGHATPEEHVLLAREARRLGVPVLLTHPGDNVTDAQFLEMKTIGAFIEVNADFYQEGDKPEEKIAFAMKQFTLLGAESIVMGSDCGQLNNPLPPDCIALTARALRAHGITDRQLDMVFKDNPARLLGLPPPAATRPTAAQSPGGTRNPGIYRSAASVRAAVDASKPELGIVAGQSTQVVAAGGGNIVVRRRVAGPNNASVHDDLTEVYQFVAGSGTFVTGGTMPDPKDRTAGITGGVSQKVQAGDYVILPPGTPHWFSQIEGSVTYVETRFPAK